MFFKEHILLIITKRESIHNYPYKIGIRIQNGMLWLWPVKAYNDGKIKVKKKTVQLQEELE